MKTHNGDLNSLPANGILVFGSNTQGRHGKGTALLANNIVFEQGFSTLIR